MSGATRRPRASGDHHHAAAEQGQADATSIAELIDRAPSDVDLHHAQDDEQPGQHRQRRSRPGGPGPIPL